VFILGIDPGTATTGYGLVSESANGDAQLEEYGTVLTPAGSPMPDRLCQLYRAVSDLCRRMAPDALAIEELFFSRNVSTALTVGQARGVVLLAAAQQCVPIYEYKPMQVKQALVGYGGASKRQIQEMLKLMLGLSEYPKPDDAADAVAVAVCHLHSARLAHLIDAG
jgi:crossover junction endodeoxyribonuclease RuvC